MHEKQVTCGHLSNSDKAAYQSPEKELVFNALKITDTQPWAKKEIKCGKRVRVKETEIY